MEAAAEAQPLEHQEGTGSGVVESRAEEGHIPAISRRRDCMHSVSQQLVRRNKSAAADGYPRMRHVETLHRDTRYPPIFSSVPTLFR